MAFMNFSKKNWHYEARAPFIVPIKPGGNLGNAKTASIPHHAHVLGNLVMIEE
jgi:hypothetical protein